jgi:glycosyltransferase involved in cell wall biosynthesis
MPTTSKTVAPVSAVMPAYNGERFIEQAIKSVFAQTLPVAEFFVVDDGSTDASAKIAERWGVRVIRQSNGGLAAARNRCFREASQPWIAFIDADDIWEPEKIEIQLRIAESEPDIALVTCDFSVHDLARGITPSILKKDVGYSRQPKRRCADGSIIDRLDPCFNGIADFLMPSFVMVRRDVIERTGLFDESLITAEDFDCFMRVLNEHKLGVAEAVLARRLEHETNLSRRLLDVTQSCLAVTYKIIAHPESYPPAAVDLCREALPGQLRHAGARLVWNGDAQRGRDLLRESAKLQFNLKTMVALTASFAPGRIARDLMSARYYMSRALGI